MWPNNPSLTQDQVIEIIQEAETFVDRRDSSQSILVLKNRVVLKIYPASLWQRALSEAMTHMTLYLAQQAHADAHPREGEIFSCILPYLGIFNFPGGLFTKLGERAQHLGKPILTLPHLSLVLPPGACIILATERLESSYSLAQLLHQRRQLKGFGSLLRYSVFCVLHTLRNINLMSNPVNHNDLHPGNVLVSLLGAGEPASAQTFLGLKEGCPVDVIPPIRRLGIIDYNLACFKGSPAIHLDDPNLRAYGISERSSNLYDAYLFLNSIYLILLQDDSQSSRSFSTSFREERLAVEFIERVVPKEYLGIGLNLAERSPNCTNHNTLQKATGSVTTLCESRPSRFGAALRESFIRDAKVTGYGRVKLWLDNRDGHELKKTLINPNQAANMVSGKDILGPCFSSEREAYEVLSNILKDKWFGDLCTDVEPTQFTNLPLSLEEKRRRNDLSTEVIFRENQFLGEDSEVEDNREEVILRRAGKHRKSGSKRGGQ